MRGGRSPQCPSRTCWRHELTGDLARSNSLVDLAACIGAEHEATAASLKSVVEHAMAAGDVLLEELGGF
jgi:hypothetical protein